MTPEVLTQQVEELVGAVLHGAPVPPLDASEFPTEASQEVWAAILEVEAAHHQVTMALVADALDKADRLIEAGGLDALQRYHARGSASAPVKTLAQAIRAAGIKRVMDEVLHGCETPDEVREVLEGLPGPLDGGSADMKTIGARARAQWKTNTTLDSGLLRLRAPNGKLVPHGPRLGQITGIAGRLGHGKTALGVALSKQLAESGHGVAYVTLEEGEVAIWNRFISLVSHDLGSPIPFQRFDLQGPAKELAEFQFSPQEHEVIDAAEEVLKGLPITILEPVSSVTRVLEVITASPEPVIVLDYLGNVAVSGKQTRQDKLEHGVLAPLQDFARLKKRAVVVLAQFNRNSPKEARRPTMEDIRDTDALALKAKQIWLAFWPATAGFPTVASSDYEINIGKNNSGGKGLVHLDFEPSCGVFTFDNPCAGKGECSRCVISGKKPKGNAFSGWTTGNFDD